MAASKALAKAAHPAHILSFANSLEYSRYFRFRYAHSNGFLFLQFRRELWTACALAFTSVGFLFHSFQFLNQCLPHKVLDTTG